MDKDRFVSEEDAELNKEESPTMKTKMLMSILVKHCLAKNITPSF